MLKFCHSNFSFRVQLKYYTYIYIFFSNYLWACHAGDIGLQPQDCSQKAHSACKWFAQSTATKAVFRVVRVWSSTATTTTSTTIHSYTPTHAHKLTAICNLALGGMQNFCVAKMKINGLHFVPFFAIQSAAKERISEHIHTQHTALE